MVNKSTFGQFLRQKRNERDDLKEFGRKTFLSDRNIKMEKGKSYPDITMIPDICSVLDISEHELISGANDTEYHEMKRNARVYRKIIETFFWGFTGAYGALIICFICDLAVNHRFIFFPVVFGSLLTAFSFVPTFTRFTEKHKLAVFTGSTYLSLVLLFVICCAKYGQNWFGAAALGTLLGYIAVFAPFLLRRHMPARGRRFILAVYFLLFFACLALLVSAARITNVFSLPKGLLIVLYSFIPFAVTAVMHIICKHPLINASVDVLAFGSVIYALPRFLTAVLGSVEGANYAVNFADPHFKRQCISIHLIFTLAPSIIARGRYRKTAPHALTWRLCNIIYQIVGFSQPDDLFFAMHLFGACGLTVEVILQNRKLKIPSEVVYILAVALLSLAVAMLMAANFGVSR